MSSKCYVGVVGGSDLDKQLEQLGEDCVQRWDYFFTQNGLVSFKHGKELGCTSMKDKIGEDKMKKLINWILGYLAKVGGSGACTRQALPTPAREHKGDIGFENNRWSAP